MSDDDAVDEGDLPGQPLTAGQRAALGRLRRGLTLGFVILLVVDVLLVALFLPRGPGRIERRRLCAPVQIGARSRNVIGGVHFGVPTRHVLHSESR